MTGSALSPEAITLLRAAVRRYGYAAFDDPVRGRGLIADALPGLRRETSILAAALGERVPNTLLSQPGGAVSPTLVDELVTRLEREADIAPAAARWSVTTWAQALGLDIEVPPVSPPIEQTRGTGWTRPSGTRPAWLRGRTIAALLGIVLVVGAGAALLGRPERLDLQQTGDAEADLLAMFPRPGDRWEARDGGSPPPPELESRGRHSGLAEGHGVTVDDVTIVTAEWSWSDQYTDDLDPIAWISAIQIDGLSARLIDHTAGTSTTICSTSSRDVGGLYIEILTVSEDDCADPESHRIEYRHELLDGATTFVVRDALSALDPLPDAALGHLFVQLPGSR